MPVAEPVPHRVARAARHTHPAPGVLRVLHISRTWPSHNPARGEFSTVLEPQDGQLQYAIRGAPQRARPEGLDDDPGALKLRASWGYS
jgi:hypothetical protein